MFIGKVTDHTNGLLIDDRNTREEGAGQYHACGVSKPSMGGGYLACALGERRASSLMPHNLVPH